MPGKPTPYWLSGAGPERNPEKAERYPEDAERNPDPPGTLSRVI